MSAPIFPEFADPTFGKLLSQCIHCGLCLQACPTYAVFGTEMDAPRGRIALMRAAAEGRISQAQFTASVSPHIQLCLACRACETACPSGVRYGALVETTRIALERHRRPGVFERFARWLGMRQAMPHRGFLKLMARVLWVYERSGLQSLVRRMRFLPRPLQAMEQILPPLVLDFGDYRTPAPAKGQKRGEVAFFIGCIQEAFLSPANQATIRCLQRNGYEVHFPPGQTCCGAAPLHVGEEQLAKALARRNIDAFLTRDWDAIINNAGGCGATLRGEYAHLFQDDPGYRAKAERFQAQVMDFSEFLLAHLNVPPTGEVKLRATYSDSCHLRHAQRIVKPPRELLKRIPGLELVELKLPDRCCGSAGVYNITQPDTANAILDTKMADIAATGADLIVATNTGCHMQLLAGVRRAGLQAKVMHLAEVLDMSYQKM
jgi:glycolate oxidase iron-sulfur subunit